MPKIIKIGAIQKIKRWTFLGHGVYWPRDKSNPLQCTAAFYQNSLTICAMFSCTIRWQPDILHCVAKHIPRPNLQQ